MQLKSTIKSRLVFPRQSTQKISATTWIGLGHSAPTAESSTSILGIQGLRLAAPSEATKRLAGAEKPDPTAGSNTCGVALAQQTTRANSPWHRVLSLTFDK